jgi:hypothetical protein
MTVLGAVSIAAKRINIPCASPERVFIALLHVQWIKDYLSDLLTQTFSTVAKLGLLFVLFAEPDLLTAFLHNA